MSLQPDFTSKLFEVLFQQQDQLAIIICSHAREEHTITYFSKGAEKLLGYSKDEVEGKPVHLIHRHLAEGTLHEIMQDFVNQGKGLSLPTAVVHKQGHQIPIEIKLEPIFNTDGTVEASIGIAFDLRPRSAVQKELERSEEKFRSLFEKSDDALLILDGENFTDFNPAVLRMLGATKEQVMAAAPWELSPELQPDGQNSFEKAFKMIEIAREEGSHRFEWLHKKMDGTTFPVEVILTSIEIEEHPVLYTVWRDITLRKEFEQGLREADEIFKLITENSHDIIWIRNMDLDHTYLSQAVEKVKGFTVEEGMKLKIEDYVKPQYLPRIQQMIQEEIIKDKDPASDPHRSVRFELEERCADGSWIWTESVISFIRGQNEQPVGILGITRDISQQKNIENELTKAKEKAEESDQLKSAFVANMSHEIRTPMNSILGFSELMADDELERKERKKYADIIHSSSTQLMSIISDIIDVSKIEAQQLELIMTPVNLDSLFNQMFEQYALVIKQKDFQDMTFTRHCESDCCKKDLLIDLNRFRQILINIIDNALKFTKKGEISFGCGEIENNLLRVYVKDTGIGIAADKLDRVFDRFYQEKKDRQVFSGTGLGLSICKSLVQLMGGEIGVLSEEGVGSEFWFTIPIQEVK